MFTGSLGCSVVSCPWFEGLLLWAVTRSAGVCPGSPGPPHAAWVCGGLHRPGVCECTRQCLHNRKEQLVSQNTPALSVKWRVTGCINVSALEKHFRASRWGDQCHLFFNGKGDLRSSLCGRFWVVCIRRGRQVCPALQVAWVDVGGRAHFLGACHWAGTCQR